MNYDVTDLAQAALALLRLQTNAGKYVELSFQPDQAYADSFLRGHRKGVGLLGMGKPAPGSAYDSLEINLTARPGVLEPGWVGYTLVIDNPETSPLLSTIQRWPETGGQEDAPNDMLDQLRPHVLRLLALPVLPVAPNREAPASMF